MLENEYQWFLENYNDLFKQYGIAFLAIKNKSVLGVYQSYAEGVKKTLQSEEPGTFIVQKCNGEESAYTNYISSMCFC